MNDFEPRSPASPQPERTPPESQVFPQVLVAVCTKDRPEALGRCLTSLYRQQYAGTWRIIVVDNSLTGSAKDQDLHDGPPTSFEHCPQGGLVTARNLALELAAASECVAFIDDDEQACPTWLSCLMTMHLAHPDDVIAGPVRPLAPTSPPDWAPDLWFYRRKSYPDASLIETSGDGNVLLPPKLVKELGLRYASWVEPLRSGQDFELFLRWTDLGGLIRWSAGAVVEEEIMPDRLDIRYPARRGYAGGLAWNVISMRTGRRRPSHVIVASAARLGQAAAMLAWGTFAGRPEITARGFFNLGLARGGFQALRISAGCDGFQQFPVGFACVEQ